MKIPKDAQQQIRNRARQLKNSNAIIVEKQHGIINNSIALNVNNNRGLLLDALQAPIKSFKTS